MMRVFPEDLTSSNHSLLCFSTHYIPSTGQTPSSYPAESAPKTVSLWKPASKLGSCFTFCYAQNIKHLAHDRRSNNELLKPRAPSHRPVQVLITPKLSPPSEPPPPSPHRAPPPATRAPHCSKTPDSPPPHPYKTPSHTTASQTPPYSLAQATHHPA